MSFNLSHSFPELGSVWPSNGQEAPLMYCRLSNEYKKVVPVFSMTPLSHHRFTSYSESMESQWRYMHQPKIAILKHFTSEEYSGIFPENFPAVILNDLAQRIQDAQGSRVMNEDYGLSYATPFQDISFEKQMCILFRLLPLIKESLEDYITSPLDFRFFDNNANMWGTAWRYQQLFNHFWGGHKWLTFRTRHPRMKFVVGRYYLAYYDYDTGMTTPLACLVTQPKYIPLLRYSQIMGCDVDSRYVQLWVHERFDVVRSEYKNLRPRYRKLIKKPLMEAGVKIVTKPNLDMLFSKFHGVKCESREEYLEFLKDSSVEILSHLRHQTGYLNSIEKEEEDKEEEDPVIPLGYVDQ